MLTETYCQCEHSIFKQERKFIQFSFFEHKNVEKMRVAFIFRLKRLKARLDANCPVYVRCTCNGERFELSTGIFLSAKFRHESLQRIKGKPAGTKLLNNRIEKIMLKIQGIHKQLDSKGSPFKAVSIKNKLWNSKKKRDW